MAPSNGIDIGITETTASRSVSGSWRFPDEGSDRARGTLVIVPGRHMELTLTGGGLREPYSPVEDPTIWGETDDGKKVTLLRPYCIHMQGRNSLIKPPATPTSNITQQVWRSHEALIGRTFFDPDNGRVAFFSLSTQKLPQWLGQLPLDFDFSENRFELSVELPQRTSFTVESARGAIGWREGAHRSTDHRQSVEIASDIAIKLPEPVKLDEVWSEWISPLMQFMLFCHGESDRIESLHLSTDQRVELELGATTPEGFEWIQSSWRGSAPASEAKYVGHHLVPFSIVRDRFEETLSNWFSIYRRARYPLMQHLAARLSDIEPFLEEKFANRVRSLESLHRDLHGGRYLDPDEWSAAVDEISDSYSDRLIDDGSQNLGRFLRDRLMHANEYSLKKRLDLLHDDAGELLASDPERWRRAHRRIVNTRNHLAHKSSLGDELSFEEVALLLGYLDELFQASVLRALKFSGADVDEALQRRPSRRFLMYPGQVVF